jgi:hypothetical protein
MKFDVTVFTANRLQRLNPICSNTAQLRVQGLIFYSFIVIINFLVWILEEWSGSKDLNLKPFSQF